MTKFTKIVGIIFLLSSLEYAYSAVTPKVSNVQFIENKGQIVDQNYNPNSAVKYLLCRPGFNVQLRGTGFSYDTYSDQTENTIGGASNKKMPHQAKLSPSRHYHRVDVELLNCNPAAEISAEGRSSFSFNYFTGGYPQGGVSDVHTYNRVIYKNIYPFIDLEFTGSDNENPGLTDNQPAEYQFILHAGAKISDIQLSYSGADAMSLEKGQLNIKVSAGVFTEKIPGSYLKENGKQVDVHYVSLGNNVYTFSMTHPFDITSDLVIDPTPCFVWGTYYGGNGYDLGSGIALDDSNNVYIAGSTTSTNKIATAGAHQTTFAAGNLYNIFVAKFNPTGTTLLWGTYYAGTGGDDGENNIAIDTSGVYITGYSISPGIATPGAWLTTCTGCNPSNAEIIVAKFSLAGALVWGTYYGSPAESQGDAIAVNASGVYISGQTYGSIGISTPGAWNTNYGGGWNAFVAKFNLSGSQLLWGTYYGDIDGYPWGLALDPAGNVYIAGFTDTQDTTKVTHGAYQTTDSGGFEGFLAKFNPTGDSLLYGTYFGGAGDDKIYDIAVDTSGNVYFTGQTTSKTGIATPGAYQTVNGNYNAFVGKLNPTGTSLLWGTYYGGNAQEECWSIALDAADNAYISGGTESPNGIATTGAYQTTLNGSSNAFIAKFNATGNSLLWGTYYGGTAYDNPPGGTYLRQGGIALNSADEIYITGFTSSYNGISSAGAWQRSQAGTPDAFVAKFGCNANPLAAFSSNDTTICTFSCINLTSLSTNADSWQWFFPGANPDTSSLANPQNICYIDSGSYDVTLVVSGAGETDTLLLPGFIQVKAAPPTPTVTQKSDTLFSSTDPSYTSYQWYDSTALISGATDTFLVINQGGNYNVQVSNGNGCKVAVGIVLGIDNLKTNKFNIYPNPATNQLTITGLPLTVDKETIEIFNMLSQRVYSSEIDHENRTIDVSRFAQGVYYLRLQANEEGAIMKFIKE